WGGGGRVDSVAGGAAPFRSTVRLDLAETRGRDDAPRPVSLVGLRVLGVDDHAINRRILEDVLISWQMQPVMFPEAPPALVELQRAAAAGEPYPLVLLDAHMPHMDGFMLAKAIQDTPTLAGTTVVMRPSAGQPDDVNRCRQLGINAYLLKPIKQSDLLATLLTVLDRSRLLTAEPVVAPAPAARRLRVLLAE